MSNHQYQPGERRQMHNGEVWELRVNKKWHLVDPVCSSSCIEAHHIDSYYKTLKAQAQYNVTHGMHNGELPGISPIDPDQDLDFPLFETFPND